MDVAIRLEGGHRWGLGHLQRQRGVAEALCELGLEVGFITTAGSEAARHLGAGGWPVHPVAAGQLVPAEVRPRLLIVDMLAQGESLRRYRGAHPQVGVITFDDVGAGLAVADAVINPLVAGWGAYDRSQVRAELLEGPAYAPLRRALTAAIEPERQVAERARTVLLAFGGSDDHGIAPRVLDLLRTVPGALELRVNRGPAARYGARLDEAIMGHPHRVMATEEDFVAEMARADLVLCAGGSMLYELAALGTVAAATAGEDHEVANIASFAEAGTLVDLGSHRDLGPAAHGGLSRALFDGPRRRAMSRAGRALVDGRGLERVVSRIMESLS